MMKKHVLRTMLPWLNQQGGFKIMGLTFLLLILSAQSFAEPHTPGFAATDVRISGRVTGPDGNGLAGVSVTVKGTNNGTSTDASGNFSIEAPGSSAVLVFSSVGFDTQEVTVGDRTSINISMVTASASLDQVVVVGYGTQRKRDVTGTITTVRGEDIAKQPNTNPISSLQGKVAGLTVVNSGRAGASPTVRIRGVNSTGNSDPLYVVDGIFQSNIDYLNPADIESIEVLKDPSSIAIFGLQGGNGVIIVTTKRAAKGETRVSFQSNVGVQKVTKKIDVVDAAGFRSLYTAQLKNLGTDTFDYKNYTANTNWQDQILRDAIINSNTITVSNSGERSTTLLSLGYNNQEGVLKYDRFQKYIARLNEEIRIGKSVKIGGDLTGFHYIQQNPGADLNNALWAAPIVPIKAADGLYYSMPSFQRAQVSNPVARLDQNDGNSINKGYRAVGSLFAEIKFLRNFTWRSSVYGDLGFNGSRSYTPLPWRYINLGEKTAPTDTSFDRAARTSVAQNQAEFRKYQQDHTLTFDKTFKNVHKFTALAGFTTLFTASQSLGGSRRDTTLNIPDDPNYWYLGVANQDNPSTNSGGGSERSYLSFFGRVNYAFDNRFLVNLSLRRDGTSQFANYDNFKNRFGTFGSVGLGWVLSDESFFPRSEKFNYFKLRGAWGTVGNSNSVGDVPYLPVLSTSSSAIFGDQTFTAVRPAYIPDSNLHWEVVRGIDVGFDSRFINNKLSAEVTFYDRNTKDIITRLTLPGTAGNYTYLTNLGTINNRGVEVALGWNDRMGRDFTYRINGNFSYNKNKVESIGNNLNFEILGNGGSNKTISGRSIGEFFGYQQTGIYQTTAQLDKTPAFVNSLPGDISYADVNGDGVISSADRTFLGSPFPTWNFGASLNLGYKNFDFLIEGQGVAGNYVYTQRRTATFAVLNYETNRLGAWTAAGSTNVEPILDNTRGNNFLFSNYFLEKGDYFRLRTVQLGYNFKSGGLSNLGVKQFRLYVSGQNIATFSRTSGYTPEAPLNDPIASGIDNGLYPVPAVYSAGINLTF